MRERERVRMMMMEAKQKKIAILKRFYKCDRCV